MTSRSVMAAVSGTVTSRDYRAYLNERFGIFEKDFFFIVGMPKSGTTWVQLLMDAHPELVCRGESNLQKRWMDPLSEAVRRYNELAAKGGANQLHSEHLDIMFLTGFLFMVEQWLENQDLSVIRCIGERTPNFMAKRVSDWTRYFPDAKYVHIMRDPRDAAVSGWFFWLRRRPERTLREYGTKENFALHFVEQWVRQMSQLDARLAGEPIACLDVRYENLVAATADEAVRIFRFLGVASDESAVGDCVARTSFQRLSGRSPGEEDETGSKFRKGVVGDWRNHFEPAFFDRFSEDLSRYQYV